MKLRRSHGEDLGDAISMEDAISMLTIVFVLFVIFLVPLVSIDKARLEQKLHDKFWIKMVAFLEKNKAPEETVDLAINQYGSEFDINSPHTLKFTRTLQDSDTVVFLEYLSSLDSSINVIRHNLQSSEFNIMRLSQGGTSTTYQHGKLAFSNESQDWFLTSDIEKDYDGTSEKSKSFKKSYRSWRESSFSKENK